MRNTARPQAEPTSANADQRARAARLRDTAGRFAKGQNSGASSDVPPAMPAPQDVPSRGTVPVSADAPEGTYALEVTGEGLGLHADAGAALIVAPEMPIGAGLAVFYLKERPVPVVYDLTHGFRPEFARPFNAGSEVVPLIEAVEPRTGRVGHLSTARVEKIHRVLGVYSAVDLPTKYGPRPPKLPLMSECPEGMGEHYVDDAVAYPLVRRFETVVYDPSLREPTHGALCVLQWNNGTRSVMLTNQRTVGGVEGQWWVDPVNRPVNRAALERDRSSGPIGTLYPSDGPYEVDHLREKIVGTVVSVLVPQRAGEPMREPDAKAASEPTHPQAAEEARPVWERERKAAARDALDDAGLTSSVSPEVRAAIVQHCEVMEATKFRGDETDEECNRDAALQIEAEAAVAHASSTSLADLRAKLLCLLPVIADNMLDQTHVEHLEAIRDDVDRLCREAAPREYAASGSAVAAAIRFHEEAYAQRLYAETGGRSDADARAKQERDAFRFLLHTALASDADRLAYAQAVIGRAAGAYGSECENSGRGAWMPTAYRNLVFGEHAPEAGELVETDEAAQVRLAATPFTPTDKNGPYPLPSKTEWIEAANGSLRWLRLGFVMMCASRDELTAVLRDQSDDEYRDLMSGLGIAARNLAQMARLADDAQNRIIIGTAILAEEERLSGKGEEV